MATRSSPRPWGCFRCLLHLAGRPMVFPTPVGVFLRQYKQLGYCLCLPHARGGVSSFIVILLTFHRSSPRPWGCFYNRLQISDLQIVFPTPVGVFPYDAAKATDYMSLPHARGGVSMSDSIWETEEGSSPRPWGCFHLLAPSHTEEPVFPTPVGVFPNQAKPHRIQRRLPHARGGVSLSWYLYWYWYSSSPRPRGVLKVLTEGLVTIWVSFWYSTGDFLSRYNLPLYIPSLFLSWL